MLEGDKRMRCHAPNITDGHVDKLLAGESTQVWLGFEVANIDKWREVSLFEVVTAPTVDILRGPLPEATPTESDCRIMSGLVGSDSVGFGWILVS